MKMIAVYSQVTNTWDLTTLDDNGFDGYNVSQRNGNIYFFVQVEMADV